MRNVLDARAIRRRLGRPGQLRRVSIVAVSKDGSLFRFLDASVATLDTEGKRKLLSVKTYYRAFYSTLY